MLIGQGPPRSVFNFNELGPNDCLPPNKTLATVKRNGKKSGKDRITVAMRCNMTGAEKMLNNCHRQVEATTSILQNQNQ